jgi:hypothetical protein
MNRKLRNKAHRLLQEARKATKSEDRIYKAYDAELIGIKIGDREIQKTASKILEFFGKGKS